MSKGRNEGMIFRKRFPKVTLGLLINICIVLLLFAACAKKVDNDDVSIKKEYFNKLTNAQFNKISDDGDILYSNGDKYIKLKKYVCDQEMAYLEIEADNLERWDKESLLNLDMDDRFYCYCIDYSTDNGNLIFNGADNTGLNESKITLVYKIHDFEGKIWLKGYKNPSNFFENEVVDDVTLKPTVMCKNFHQSNSDEDELMLSELSLYIYHHGTGGFMNDSVKVMLEYSDGTKTDINDVAGMKVGGEKEKGKYMCYEFPDLLDVEDVDAIYINDEKYVCD